MNFYSDGLRDLKEFVTFGSLGETAINFLDLILAQNSVDNLNIAKSYKDIAKGVFIMIAPKNLNAFLTFVYAAEIAN